MCIDMRCARAQPSADLCRTFGVRQPDNPAEAVRAAELIRDVEPFEAARGAPGDVERRGAAHAADADHDAS